MKVRGIVDAVFCTLQSRGSTRERRARISTLEDKDVSSLAPIIGSERGFNTGDMAHENNSIMESSIAGMVLRSGLHATEDSVRTKCDRPLEE